MARHGRDVNVARLVLPLKVPRLCSPEKTLGLAITFFHKWAFFHPHGGIARASIDSSWQDAAHISQNSSDASRRLPSAIGVPVEEETRPATYEADTSRVPPPRLLAGNGLGSSSDRF